MKRLRPGRPKGSNVAFLKSPRRFEVAIWVAATSNGMSDYQAANLAVALIRSDKPIAAARLNGSFSVLSTKYYGCILIDKEGRRQRNADHFTRYALDVTAQASTREHEWIVGSAQYLGALVACGDDQIAAKHCLNELAKLGWADTLARFATRLEPALCARTTVRPRIFQATSLPSAISR